MIEVQMFLDNEDSFQGKPLDEYILRYLMHHDIKGATLFNGYLGFGSHHHLHAPGKIAASDAMPVMIVFVDEEEKVHTVLPHLREVVAEGLIVAFKVVRV